MKKSMMFAFAAAWTVTSISAAVLPEVAGGSDSDRIENAIKKACENGERSVEIPRMNPARNEALWLIDRAILLPDDFTLTLNGATVRLAPGTKDNLIRNAGAQITGISTNRNITVRGIGKAVLSGGFTNHYAPNRSGDVNGWRTIGILFCAVEGFTIENLTLHCTQAWGISVENGCCDGRISNIFFEDKNENRNQDGVDVRKGCHDILIENIFGRVGDDAVALTGLRRTEEQRTITYDRMQIGGNWETGSDDIYNITIRNVQTKCLGGHGIVRLLNQDGVKMYNIIVRDVIDTATGNEPRAQATVRIGDVRYWQIRRSELGEMRNILVDGVMAKGKVGVTIKGPLQDAVIRNIFIENPSVKKYEIAAPVERVRLDEEASSEKTQNVH